jgi:hypothetical protein
MVLIALLACAPERPTAERPVVVASSRELDFGWIEQGGAATQELVLRNDGGLPFGIASWETYYEDHVLGGGFSIEGPAPDTVVAPGESAVFTITLTPEASRSEDVLTIWFFEDEKTAWLDREHVWMPVRLGGNGVGLPPAEEPQPFVVGGALPDRTGVEPGDTVTLEVRAYEPMMSSWSAKDGEGTIDWEGGTAEWTAPPDVSYAPGADGALFRLSYIGVDADQLQFWDFIELTVWREGTLREPVILEEEH